MEQREKPKSLQLELSDRSVKAAVSASLSLCAVEAALFLIWINKAIKSLPFSSDTQRHVPWEPFAMNWGLCVAGLLIVSVEYLRGRPKSGWLALVGIVLMALSVPIPVFLLVIELG